MSKVALHTLAGDWVLVSRVSPSGSHRWEDGQEAITLKRRGRPDVDRVFALTAERYEGWPVYRELDSERLN